MTTLDWIIVALVLLSVAAGFTQGFVAGAATLIGFAVGTFLGGRLGQAVVANGSQSPYAPLFALLGAMAGGLILASILETAGHGLRRRLTLAPGLGVVDGVGGAALAGAVALGLAWLAGNVVLQKPPTREWRDAVQRSSILRALNGALPPSGAILNALARFDPVPRIDGPPADVPAPRAAIARDPDIRAAARGVVKIQGTACGLGVEGSGWIAAPGIVVTNAHVVAGQDDTTAQLEGTGPQLAARAVAYDARNDIAVLRVSGLGGRPLRLAPDPRRGAAGAVLGFPENGPYDVRAARLGATVSVLTQDAYGRGPLRRSIVALRGTVRSGNSGGPVVGADGRVLATVFAATRGSGPPGGYGVPNAIVRERLRGLGGEVSTGPCAG